MRKYLSIMLLIMVSVSAMGQGKLIQSSEKSKPKWVTSKQTEKYALRVETTSALSVDNAEQNAFTKLREYVINTTVDYMIEQERMLNTYPDKANLERDIRGDVENSDFVNSISPVMAIDRYWEIRNDKKTGTTHYYWLLYNYTDFQMKEIAMEIRLQKNKKSFNQNFE